MAKSFFNKLDLPRLRSSSLSTTSHASNHNTTTTKTPQELAPRSFSCSSSSSSSSPLPPSAPNIKKENPSSSADSLSMWGEVTRLQEKEKTLLQMLKLEREKRVRAEQLVEVEMMACHELEHRLHLEVKKRAISERESARKEGNMNMATLTEDDMEELAEEDPSENEEEEKARGEGSQLKPNLLASLQKDYDFSLSVFGQLTSTLQNILREGEDEGNSSISPFSQALDAVKSNDPTTLQKHISSLEPNDGLPLAKLAAEKGHAGCLKVLATEKKFDLYKGGGKKTMPLHLAAKNGRRRCILVLVDFGVQLDPLDEDGHTPIFLALQEGHKECSKSLLEAGASLDTISNSGRTLLHAAVIGRKTTALRLLLVHLKLALDGSKVRELINKQDEDGLTALHIAASKKLKGCMEVLCTYEELNLTLKDRWNYTPLDKATGITKDILLNRESKSVILYVKMPPSYHLPMSPCPPHSPKSCDPSFEGLRFDLAVGTLSILRHHHFSDIEKMTYDVLHHFSSFLNTAEVIPISNMESTSNSGGCGWDDDTRVGLTEQIQRRYRLAETFISPSLPKSKSDSEAGMENGDLERDSYLEHCKSVLKEFHSRCDDLQLFGESIESFSIGNFSWRAGKLPRSLGLKNLFNLLADDNKNAIYVSLKGGDEGCFDQLSLELMMPSSQLKEHFGKLEKHKKLMIHGPQGSGRTHLAKSLASHFQDVHGADRTRVIHAPLHRSFRRADLFQLLCTNGLLLPTSEGRGQGPIIEVTPPAASQHKTHVLILDDLSLLSQPGLLTEFTFLLDHRGMGHSLWVNEVFSGNGEEVLYPGGLYYILEECYVICTWNAGCTLPQLAADKFPHVPLGVASGAASGLSHGVLHRQLITSSVHYAKGVWPYKAQPLYRLFRWVGDIWVLYNQILKELGLSSVATGLRDFLCCPVDSACPEQEIPEWLSSLWQNHLVPSVEFAMQERLSTSESKDLSPQTIIIQVLQAIFGLAFLPTCPLSFDKRDKFIEGLKESLKGPRFATPTSTPTASSTEEHVVTKKPPSWISPVFSPQYPNHHSLPNSARPTPILNMRRGSLQCLNGSLLPGGGSPSSLRKSSPLSRRRGSISDLRPSFLRSEKKAENMVSYEDLIRNSPRLKSKRNHDKKVESSLNVTPPSSPHELTVSAPSSFPWEEEDGGKGGGGGGEEGGQDKKVPKESMTNKALRKIRGINLFSKEGGGTIPRLFRQKRRASISHVVKPDPHSSTSNSARHNSVSSREDFTQSLQLHHTRSGTDLSAASSKGDFTKSLDEANLDEIYDMITSENLSRFEEQRSPPPSSPIHDIAEEDDDAENVLDRLDDFLDLHSDPNSDQMSPVPPMHKPTSLSLEEKSVGVPKYYLSTGSPRSLLARQGNRSPVKWSMRDMSPPAYSMPDLTGEALEEVDEELDSAHNMSPHAIYPSDDQLLTESHDYRGAPPINKHKSYSTASILEGTDQSHDQSFSQVTSPKGQPYENHLPTTDQRRRVSDYSGRCTSPLAMTSYTSQSQSQSSLDSVPSPSSTSSQGKGNTKIFNFIPKKVNGRTEKSQQRRFHNSKTDGGQPPSPEVDQKTPPRLNKGERRNMPYKAGKFSESEMSFIGIDGDEKAQRKECKDWTQESDDVDMFSPRNMPHDSSPESHASPRCSSITRGRYVNEEIGRMYRSRSNSYAAKATHGHSDDIHQSKKPLQKKRLSSYSELRGRDQSSSTSSSEAGVRGSGVLFSATLGFLGPNSSLLKTAGSRRSNTPTNI